MRTVAFCEIDPYCRRVLAKHWPDVPIHHDVTKLKGTDVGPVDVIAGGFPCQDISTAGKGAGITGERSGLWKEYARIIGEVRPRYVIVENVAALLSRGLGDVLGDLSTLGYDTEWHCIPASAVGAPHRRDRIWIVANASERRCGGSDGWQVQQPGRAEAICGSEDVADARSSRQPGPRQHVDAFDPAPGFIGQAIKLGNGGGPHQWLIEPDVGRVANGVPARVDRLRSLGNAVVPQIPELIGRAIMRVQA